jgi:hypothetical protein
MKIKTGAFVALILVVLAGAPLADAKSFSI